MIIQEHFLKCFDHTNRIVGATVSDFGLPWDLLAKIDFLVSSYFLTHTLSEKSGGHFENFYGKHVSL